MYDQFFNNFFNQNKNIIILNTILAIFIYPLEIGLLSYLSGKIFFTIKNQDIRKFLISFIIFTLVFIFICVLFWISERMDAMILPRLQTSIRKDILNFIFQNNLDTPFLQSGELINKFNNIPYFIYLNYINIVTYICPLFFSILFFTLFMFFIHYSLGILSIIFFLIFIICFASYLKKTVYIAKNRYELDNYIMNSYEDILKNNVNITLHNQRRFEKSLFFNNNTQYQTILNKEMNHIYDMKIIFTALLVIFFIILTIVACYLHSKNDLELFKLIVFVSAMMLMMKTFHSLIKRTADSVSNAGPLLLEDQIKGMKKIPIHLGTKKDFLENFEIKLVDLSYQFSDDKPLFKNVTLTIPFKTKIVITGDIGLGKSTLFQLLSGYLHTSNGLILYDNVDIQDIDINYLRDHMTIMHQNIHLFKRSVLENIFYGENPDSVEWNNKLKQLKELSIYPKMKSFIHHKTTQFLSGGQRQIVLLLRCYFKYPKIILLDEPTANVDYKTRTLIIDILSLLKDATIICITHDRYLIQHFNDHYELKNYQLIKIKS